MKPLFTLVVVLSLTFSESQAQCLLPNGDFEEWVDKTEEFETELDLELTEEVIWPTGYNSLVRLVFLAFSDILLPYFDTGVVDQALFGGVLRVEPGANGSGSALQIQADTLLGIVDLLTSFECTEMPTSLKGFYRYTGESVDTLLIGALLHSGDPVTELEDAEAGAQFIAAGGPEEFTEFEVPFEYIEGFTADSMTLIILVQKDENSAAVGTFQIDQLSLEGTSTAVANVEVTYELIAPNPAFDHLEILAAGVDRIEVINFNGQRVLDINQPVATVDISALVPGTYVAKSVIGDQVVVQKFMKL